MAIDYNSNPFLFSVGTWFANKIDRRYYGNVHYVWCTSQFNNREQPITSRPQSICKRYFDQIFSGDRHTKEIKDNIAGILRGAQAKLEAGVINKEKYDEICQLINTADYEAFYPVLYIIDVKKIGASRCEEMDKKDCASDVSVEYRIADLSEGEYELIDFKAFLSDYLDAVDKKAGE